MLSGLRFYARFLLAGALLFALAGTRPVCQRVLAGSGGGAVLSFRPATNQESLAGGKIAFAADGDIYVMDSDGSNLRRLTLDGPAVDDDYPALSPDGTRVAFSSNRDGTYEIYVADVDGPDTRQLTKSAFPNVSPAWSPDGGKIAFVRGEDLTDDGVAYFSSCLSEIFVIGADGEGELRLTVGGGNDPAWSPDGARIAFSSNRTGNFEIYTMGSDGGDLKQLTDTPSAEADPAWSPDGQFIAFGGDYAVAHFDCGFMHTGPPGGGGGPELIDHGGHPTAGGGGNIYVMSADGSGLRRLTSNGSDSDPAWSPDGTQLVFVSHPDGGTQTQVTVMSANGRRRTVVTQDATHKSSPSWSAGGPGE